MTAFLKILSSFIFLIFLTSWNANAQQAAAITDSYSWQVKIQEENSFDEDGLQFLKWSRSVYLVQSNGFKNYVAIKGQFREPVKQALLNGKPYLVNPDGSFTLKLVIKHKEKIRFNIFATSNVDGREHKMQYTLIALNPKAPEAPLSWWRFSAGTGLTLISFRQRNVISFDEWALTVKAAATYRWKPDQWDLGISAFYNVAAISSNSPENYKIQYLGFNAKAAYHLLDGSSPWQINLSGGMYFNSSVSVVGFAGMFGPQISPEVSYVFHNGNTLFWYGKFAYALSGDHSRFFKDNREVATGIHYSFPITLTNRLSIGVDLSQLSLTINNDWASTNTYSLSGGLSF